jgi:hypothetical protein
MDRQQYQLQFAFGKVLGDQYYILIKRIFDQIFRNIEGNQRMRNRLSLEAIVDPITDFVDKDPSNIDRIKRILSSAYSGDFITYLCEYLSSRFRTKPEIDTDFEGIVNHFEALIAGPPPPGPPPPGPPPPGPPPGSPPVGPADGMVVFPEGPEGGKRRSIKKRRKSMSKRRKNRKNRRKSNKKQ